MPPISRVLAPLFAFIAIYFFHWWMLGVLFVFIFMVGGNEYRSLLRREQEAAYWAEMARRVAEAKPPGDQPPLIAHGPN